MWLNLPHMEKDRAWARPKSWLAPRESAILSSTEGRVGTFHQALELRLDGRDLCLLGVSRSRDAGGNGNLR